MHILFILITILGIYIGGVIFLYAWNGLIGFGFELDDDNTDTPSIVVVAWLWPITIWPLLFFIIDVNFKRLRNHRHSRAKLKSEIEEEKAELRKKFCEREKP
jgi:TRAP-type C4-dicarboxylate transport system permease small subunit